MHCVVTRHVCQLYLRQGWWAGAWWAQDKRCEIRCSGHILCGSLADRPLFIWTYGTRCAVHSVDKLSRVISCCLLPSSV